MHEWVCNGYGNCGTVAREMEKEWKGFGLDLSMDSNDLDIALPFPEVAPDSSLISNWKLVCKVAEANTAFGS